MQFETGDGSVVGIYVNKCNQPPAGEFGKFTDVTLNCVCEEEILLCVDNAEVR